IASFGAVLAGAVWGNNSSPISDTTILSSTCAVCTVATHVSTQFPHAFVGAISALLGYVMYALTLSGIAGLVTTVGLVVGSSLVIRKLRPVWEEEQASVARQVEAVGGLCKRVCMTQDLRMSRHCRRTL